MRYSPWIAMLLVFSAVSVPAHGRIVDRGIVTQLERAKERAYREPGTPNPHLLLARLYGDLGDQARVEEHCRLAKMYGAHPARVGAILGEFLLHRGELARALQVLVSAQTYAPRSHAINVLVWEVLVTAWRRGDRSLGQVDRQQALGILSARGYYVPAPVRRGYGPAAAASAGALVAQGNGFLSGNGLRDAYRAFTMAADADPTNPAAYRGLAIVMARLGQTDRAAAGYALYLSLAPPGDPDVPAVRDILLDYYHHEGTESSR